MVLAMDSLGWYWKYLLRTSRIFVCVKPINPATKGRLYAAGQIADLDALNNPMSLYELGANYYLTGTLGPKLSLGYQNRAIFEKSIHLKVIKVLVLQFQISSVK
jgi:hypothetical protein